MIKVGLTGGIGSGKTTVARILSLLGVPVYNCDERARRISDCDTAVVRAVKELLGEEAYVDGRQNRPYIAGRVFADRALLAELNAIVHPAVLEDYRLWVARHAGVPYTVMESAILFESGLDREVDEVVVVTAPEEVRIARSVLRDGVDEEAIRKRIRAQMGEEERIARAGHVLYADEHRLLIPQVLELHDRFSGMI